MGCGTSKRESENFDLTEIAPDRPLPPGTDDAFTDLDKDYLEDGLRQVASYITKRKRNIRIVAVGGAVSTILLQTRRVTHDIDFFAEGLSQRDTRLLIEAARVIRQQPGSRFKEDWINNRTIYFISPELRQILTNEGFRQNEIVFYAPGLTVYAAPWTYAFASKLHRISGASTTGSQARPHDPDDAANFLHQFLQKTGGTNITIQTVSEWLHDYNIKIPQEGLRMALLQTNHSYERIYGSQPIQN